MRFPGRHRYGRHSHMRAQSRSHAEYSGSNTMTRHSVDLHN